MNSASRRRNLAGGGLLALVMVTSSLTQADATSHPWDGAFKDWTTGDRLDSPEGRFDLAGGCYAIADSSGGYLQREGDTFAPTGGSVSSAEPFHFQATDLGSYLVYSSDGSFLAASEGALAEAVYGVSKSNAGQNLGGVTITESDKLADQIARSDANKATGRGAAIVAAALPSELADWKLLGTDGTFEFSLPATDQKLGSDGDALVLDSSGDAFAIELTDGCAVFPDIEVNVDGSILGGEADYQEVRGFMEAHLHMMAFEFIGGRSRCGRPWHRYGVAYALVDCPDHEPDGRGALLEHVLSNGNPVVGHDTDGWPSFVGWPKPGSLTHEQVYYKWLERAWRGGLRLAVNLLVDNRQLCQIYPVKNHGCNEMDGVRLQAQRIRELQDYIDAQWGGPGKGWFRVVTDPFEARQVMNEGRLAVVLGIEVSVPLDCGMVLDVPMCDEQDIATRLDEVKELGVTQMELVNKFDNALSGVTGDGGTTGVVVNQGNKGETGQYWRFETCADSETEAHDKQQLNLQDDANAPDQLLGRDAIFGGVMQLFGTSGAAPVYPEGPHCNVVGLSALGEAMIRGLADRGMIFDPDHMSARARTQAMDLIEAMGYSGVVSSHSWADDTIYPRIWKAGGVVAPHAGGSTSFIGKWLKQKGWKDDRFLFGLGYGSDMNGFSAQGNPRGESAANKVSYPFAGFGGAIVNQQVSGSKTYNINTDGVAHYGMYPDWIEDMRRQAGGSIVEDMALGAEAYLQMWERAVGIEGNACRSDIADLSSADVDMVSLGMTPIQVIELLGQPETRTASAFTFCGETGSITISFADGLVSSIGVA